MSPEKDASFVSMINSIKDDLKIYPLLPYVQKYVVAANQKGMLNVILDSKLISFIYIYFYSILFNFIIILTILKLNKIKLFIIYYLLSIIIL